VLVGGLPARSAARRVAADESISVRGEGPRFVSRGGEKLAAALDHFDVGVTDRSALDAGASTGGFTDCLLQAGGAHVVAVDVGRGQLAWSLRTNPHVTVLERTNVRHLTPDDIGGRVDLCTADLSFISLTVCAPALVRCVTADADLVLLVKPQFEAGRRESEEAGAVIGVVERNDAALAGGEQRCSQCDLDSVGTGDPELRGPRQTLSKLRGDRGVRKIAERMCDGSRGDRRHHARVPMTESGNAEAAGQVEIFASVRVPDAAALGPGPDQAPLRPISRPSVSAAM